MGATSRVAHDSARGSRLTSTAQMGGQAVADMRDPEGKAPPEDLGRAAAKSRIVTAITADHSPVWYELTTCVSANGAVAIVSASRTCARTSASTGLLASYMPGSGASTCPGSVLAFHNIVRWRIAHEIPAVKGIFLMVSASVWIVPSTLFAAHTSVGRKSSRCSPRLGRRRRRVSRCSSPPETRPRSLARD
jgi:hypothetical protein